MSRATRSNVIRDAYLLNPRKKRVIVCEELNFLWDDPELKELAEMWVEGGDVRLIANYFDRDPDEILMALVHLARKDQINTRKGGLLLGY